MQQKCLLLHLYLYIGNIYNMKSFYQPLLYFTHTFILLILLFTGFSCSSGDETVSAPGNDSMMPSTTKYVINGKVVDEENTDKGLANILIEVKVDIPHASVDSIYTEKNGKFYWTGPVTNFNRDALFTLSATDTTEIYQQNETTVSFTKEEIDNNASWYLGEAEKEVLIKLKEIVN